MRIRGQVVLLTLLAMGSSVAPAAAESLRCTRVLPEASFPRQILEIDEDAGVPRSEGDAAWLPPEALSDLAPYRIISEHDMDLSGNGETTTVLVEGIVFKWFGFLYFPRILWGIDPATGQTLWNQELTGGLFGPGRVGDFDGDGLDDLQFDQFQMNFFFFSPAGFRFLWGNGEGPLEEGFRSRSAPRFERLDDRDGDGVDDAVVALDSHRAIYPGLTSRSFDEGIRYTTLAKDVIVDEPGRQLAIGDVNEDGLDDVLAFTQFEFSQSLGISRGDGTFDVSPLPLPEERPVTGTFRDLDADGHLDLVLVQFRSPRDGFWVGWGRGDGTFEPYEFLDVGKAFHEYTLGDATGDGQDDFAVAFADSECPGVETCMAVIPLRERRLDPAVPFDFPGSGSYIDALTFADVDRDGLADLVLPLGETRDAARLVWLRSAGGGGVESPRDLVDPPFDHRIDRIVPTDFDLDGILDLFVQVADTRPGGTSNVSLRGEGDGRFEVVFRTGPTTPYRHDLFLDVDADGRPDLVSRREYEAYDGNLTYPVFVRYGDGLGGFGPPTGKRWLGFAGDVGRFRTAGTLDMARIGWFGDRTDGPFIFGKGLFQLEVYPSTGFVLGSDQGPPEVEIRVLPVPGSGDPHLVRVATLPRDECSSAPTVTKRYVNLLSMGEGVPFAYREAESTELRVYEIPGTGARGALLLGPDFAHVRDLFLSALETGGFPFRHMTPMRVVSTGEYGEPLPGFPMSRLVQRIRLNGGFVVEAEVHLPGAGVIFSAEATDGIPR